MAIPPTKTPRTCSQCGNNGHNARTCTELGSCIATKSTTTTTTKTTCNTSSTPPPVGFMLFGVRLTATDGCTSSPSSASSPTTLSNSSSSCFRKSMSMNNLSQYDEQAQLPHDSNNPFANVDVSPTGYASDDALHASASRTSRERKRGTPWTEEEHRLFLVGLNKVGKGDWRGISRNFVKTRTPTQVASHAQKYFLRRNNINRRRRRSSLFDITADAVKHSSMDNQLLGQDSKPQLKTSATFGTPYPPTLRPISTKVNRSIPSLPVPPSSKMASLNLNKSPTMSSSTSNYSTKEREYEPFLALKLSQEPSDEESTMRSPTFGGFKGNGDNIISVA